MSPPSPPSPGSVANGLGTRRQPDPPSNGFGDGGAVAPPIATSALRGSTARGENASSGSTAAQAPPSVSSALSSIGGEPLVGSGFETQPSQRGFAPASVNASDGAAAPAASLSSPSTARTAAGGDSAPSGPVGASNPTGPANPESSGVLSDVTSVGSTGPANPPPHTAAREKGGFTRVADQVRGFRHRLGSLPSDAAPHATPPRIPIEHEE